MSLFGFLGPFAGSSEPAAWQAYAAAERGDSTQPLVRPQDEAACTASATAVSGNLTLALQGGPVWLGNAPCAGRPAETADSLLAAYRASGEAVLDQLQGRFALAIIDAPARRVLLALDPMGIERMAYAVAGDGIVFSTSAEAVARFPAVGARLSTQSLFDFLLLHIVPAPDTVFTGVHKLRAGTCAVFENGKLRTRRCWNPRVVETGGEPVPELARQLHDALRGAVRAAEPDEQTGAFLSGGLDSSTVVGMYASVAGRPVHSFSMGFGVDEYNEIEYARIASRRYGAVAHEYQVTPEDVVAAFPRIAAAYDEPFGNSSAVPTYMCAKVAAESGFHHLLAGDGGDEIFAGNERYAKQGVFEAYGHIPGPLRRLLVEPLAMSVHAESRITPLRKLRSYVEQARIPMPERLEYWNFIYQTDLDAMLEPEFRHSIDTRAPLARMSEVYAASPGQSTLNRMLYLDWQYTLSDNDLRKVSTMCRLSGVRVSYPMLHPDVINLSIKVPPGVLMPGNRLRHFYKQAMRGFLPDEIILKKKHGFGLPFGQWLKVHRPFAELIYALLADLKKRRLVRAAFIDRLIEDQRAGHASYFGYAIWDLAMLEAWLAVHA